MPKKIEGHETFKQLWFAGNHSDVGGSYPEVECRLSDLALLWMIEEATAIPHGLKIAPVFSNGKKVPNTGNKGQALHLFPAADGVQHCEVAAMRDVLDARLPAFIRRLFPRAGWKVEIRDIDEQAIVHPSVVERFELAEVSQYAGFGPYRPDGLRNPTTNQKPVNQRSLAVVTGASTGIGYELARVCAERVRGLLSGKSYRLMHFRCAPWLRELPWQYQDRKASGC